VCVCVSVCMCNYSNVCENVHTLQNMYVCILVQLMPYKSTFIGCIVFENNVTFVDKPKS